MNSLQTDQCQFPLFRERFLQPTTEPSNRQPHDKEDASPRKQTTRLGKLKVGDSLRLTVLESLPRDDGPPTELRARKEKLALFEKDCSWVGDRLFVGSEAVAKNRETLREKQITHVVNCVGFLYPPYFEDELKYQTLYLQDTPGEDILSVMYDVFDFIEEAGEDGRVLVHCSQGVSRSATLAIAYLMWKRGAGYDEVFTAVKAKRGVANPNIGFICQLLQWHKRRSSGIERCRLYRIAPQSASAPQYLVAKPVGAPQPASLDPRGAFVVQTPDVLAVWVGAACPEPFAAAGERFARQLVAYEGAAGPPTLVHQGQESSDLWCALVPPEHSSSSSQDAAASPVAAPPSAAPVAAEAAEGGDEVWAAAAAAECSAYDKDYELYHRSLTSRSGGDSGDSARSGKKTPRDEGKDHAISPNERLRKHARGPAAAGAAQQTEQQQHQRRQQQQSAAVSEAPGPLDRVVAAVVGGSTSSAPSGSGPITRSRSKSPCKSPCKSPTRRLSRRQSALLEGGLGELRSSLDRGLSMGTVEAEIVSVDLALEENATPPALQRAASDLGGVTPPDGSLTARGLRTEAEAAAAAARAAGSGSRRRPAVPPINLKMGLGRS